MDESNWELKLSFLTTHRHFLDPTAPTLPYLGQGNLLPSVPRAKRERDTQTINTTRSVGRFRVARRDHLGTLAFISILLKSLEVANPQCVVRRFSTHHMINVSSPTTRISLPYSTIALPFQSIAPNLQSFLPGFPPPPESRAVRFTGPSSAFSAHLI